MALILPLVFIICGYFSTASADSTLGPADFVIQRVEECENPNVYSHQYDVTLSKVNRTHSGFTFCYNLTVPMDDNFSLNVTAAKWGDGGWKPNAFVFSGDNACKVLETHLPKPFAALRRALGITYFHCPIEKGFYCVKDFVFDLEALFPSMLYGTFRIDSIFLSKTVPFACFRVYANSVPTKASAFHL